MNQTACHRISETLRKVKVSAVAAAFADANTAWLHGNAVAPGQQQTLAQDVFPPGSTCRKRKPAAGECTTLTGGRSGFL
jgi:hypothetical protein